MKFLQKLLGRTDNALDQARQDYLSKHPEVGGTLHDWQSDLATESLPDEYNNVPIETYIDGRVMHTVGELKDYLAKRG